MNKTYNADDRLHNFRENLFREIYYGVSITVEGGSEAFYRGDVAGRTITPVESVVLYGVAAQVEDRTCHLSKIL